MWYLLFRDTRTNFKRWNICFGILVALFLMVIGLMNVSQARVSSSTWDGIVGWTLLIGGGSYIYWLALLASLSSRLKLNTELWIAVSIIGGPLGVIFTHFKLVPRISGYLGNGGK